MWCEEVAVRQRSGEVVEGVKRSSVSGAAVYNIVQQTIGVHCC